LPDGTGGPTADRGAGAKTASSSVKGPWAVSIESAGQTRGAAALARAVRVVPRKAFSPYPVGGARRAGLRKRPRGCTRSATGRSLRALTQPRSPRGEENRGRRTRPWRPGSASGIRREGLAPLNGVAPANSAARLHEGGVPGGTETNSLKLVRGQCLRLNRSFPSPARGAETIASGGNEGRLNRESHLGARTDRQKRLTPLMGRLRLQFRFTIVIPLHASTSCSRTSIRLRASRKE
jgi:hypothetical protein